MPTQIRVPAQINITADIPLSNHKITTTATTFNNDELVTKSYVDGVAQGLKGKQSVKAATDAAISLTGAQSIDGVSVVQGDRVLVKTQGAAAQEETTSNLANGIYIVNNSAWTRAADADAWGELISAYVFVEQGTKYADTGWICMADAGGTLGSTAIQWTQFSQAGTVTASNVGTGTGKVGLFKQKNGTTLEFKALMGESATGLTITPSNSGNDNVQLSLSGTLAIANGGTNTTGSGFTANQVMYYDGTKITTTGYLKDDVVTLTGSQTLTNKSLKDSTTWIVDEADVTKRMRFEASGITTGTDRVLTIPNANTTLVGTDTTQTLTNKTLTNPKIQYIFGNTAETNKVLQIEDGASVAEASLTWLKMTSGIGSGAFLLNVMSTGTNADIDVAPKGTGIFSYKSNEIAVRTNVVEKANYKPRITCTRVSDTLWYSSEQIETNSEQVYVNGILQSPTDDYTIAWNNSRQEISFTYPVIATDKVKITYLKLYA